MCRLPSVKKQKHDFQLCFVDRARHRKNSGRQRLREPEEKKELAQTLKTFYVEARKKESVQCIIKQLLDSVLVISRIIKVSGKGYQPQPTASVDNSYLGVDYSGVSQKLHPIIVYKQINSFCLTMVRETFWMVNWVAGHTR